MRKIFFDSYVTRTFINLRFNVTKRSPLKGLPAAGLFKFVCPFSGYQALKC